MERDVDNFAVQAGAITPPPPAPVTDPTTATTTTTSSSTTFGSTPITCDVLTTSGSVLA